MLENLVTIFGAFATMFGAIWDMLARDPFFTFSCSIFILIVLAAGFLIPQRTAGAGRTLAKINGDCLFLIVSVDLLLGRLAGALDWGHSGIFGRLGERDPPRDRLLRGRAWTRLWNERSAK